MLQHQQQQKPSQFIMYRKFPLDLNIHSAELNSFQPDMALKLQAPRAPSATAQALFLDACTVKAVPSMGGVIHGMYDPAIDGLYDPIPQFHQFHQQQQLSRERIVPVPAAVQWQQQMEVRGCWFPNWHEVFDGFVAAKDAQQQKQVKPASFHHQYHHPGSAIARDAAYVSSFRGDHRQSQAHSNFNQSLDLISAPRYSATLGQAHSDRKSHNTRIVFPARKNHNTLVSCTDTKDSLSAHPIEAIPCTYTTASPSWLPPGWITEVRTRKTGITAGTRDKYYKDLVSGRRFRSRNEVFHFLQTGKGRLRKKERQIKAIASSSFTGTHLLCHQVHPPTEAAAPSSNLIQAPQPLGFLLGAFASTHLGHVGRSVPAVPTAVVAEEIEAVISPTSSSKPSVMFGLKRPVDGRAQKLPVRKKAKIISPKKCEDKQASRLWQWLQKPVRTNEETEKQDMQTSSVPVDEQKNAEEARSDLQVAHRTAQLGKEIESARRVMTFLSKEMQATVEKMNQEILAVQREIELSDETEVGIKRKDSEREMQANDAMSNVINAAERLGGAMENVMQATQNLVVAMSVAVQVTQRHDDNVGSMLQTAKQPLAATSNGTQTVASRSHVVGPRSPSMAVKGPDLTMEHLSQATQRPVIAASCAADAAPQLPNVATRFAIQGAQAPEVAISNTENASQNHVVTMSYAPTQAVQSIDAATSIVDVAHTSSIRLNKNMHTFEKTVALSKEIMETRSRNMRDNQFAALNPKLDLSSLSPSLSSQQRAKVVQRMKAKHVRSLLVILGRRLCYKALLHKDTF